MRYLCFGVSSFIVASAALAAEPGRIDFTGLNDRQARGDGATLADIAGFKGLTLTLKASGSLAAGKPAPMPGEPHQVDNLTAPPDRVDEEVMNTLELTFSSPVDLELRSENPLIDSASFKEGMTVSADEGATLEAGENSRPESPVSVAASAGRPISMTGRKVKTLRVEYRFTDREGPEVTNGRQPFEVHIVAVAGDAAPPPAEPTMDQASPEVSEPEAGAAAEINGAAVPAASVLQRPADRSFVYRTVGGRDLKMLVYGPADAAAGQPPRPAVMLFYGGGWKSGQLNQFARQAAYLADQGVRIYLPEYRVADVDQTTPAEAVDDALAAWSWLQARAQSEGVDPRRIAAGGGSAGGHLALMILLHPDAPSTARPAALLLFNPILDVGPDGYGHDLFPVQAEAWRNYSPLHRLADTPHGLPPALVMLGTRDDYVPVATAREFQQKYRGPLDLKLYPDQPHGFFNPRPDDDAMFRQTLHDVAAFLHTLDWL